MRNKCIDGKNSKGKIKPQALESCNALKIFMCALKGIIFNEGHKPGAKSMLTKQNQQKNFFRFLCVGMRRGEFFFFRLKRLSKQMIEHMLNDALQLQTALKRFPNQKNKIQRHHKTRSAKFIIQGLKNSRNSIKKSVCQKSTSSETFPIL